MLKVLGKMIDFFKETVETWKVAIKLTNVFVFRSNDNHQFSDADELIRALRAARLLSSSSDSYEPPGDDDAAATSSTGNSAARLIFSFFLSCKWN